MSIQVDIQTLPNLLVRTIVTSHEAVPVEGAVEVQGYVAGVGTVEAAASNA